MKICSPELGISPNSFMGGEVYDAQIIDNLAKMGVKWEILLPRNREYKSHQNISVEYLPIRSIFPPHIFNLLAIPYLFRKYQRTNFDILRIHSPYFLGLAAQIFKKKYPKVKIVTQILLEESAFDREYILRKTIHVYDHIFVLTDFLKSRIIKRYGIDESKITTIYGGVDPNLKPAKKDPQLLKKFSLNDKTVLLNVGRMIPRKNLLFLLEVYKHLLKLQPNLSLIFCGEGSQKNMLRKKIDRENIPNVYILDSLYGQEKNKLFNLADIFMFPTKGEGFGLVAAEALSCGKPVIASNNTSLPEVVSDKVSGFLVETDNLDQWVEKAILLIDDNDLRSKLSKNALIESKKFTWQAVAKKHLQIFNQLLND